jgi:ferric-dicitrate binding protein FerR (iron transport regulator)
MKFKDYDIEHFLADDFFIQWVKNPDENNRHFWEKWMEQHPEKRPIINEAVILIRSIKYANKPEFTDRMYVETFENIIKEDEKVAFPKPESKSEDHWFSFFSIRKIAATVIIGLCIWIGYDSILKGPLPQELLTEIPMVIKSNPSGKKSIITLGDGTKIYLNASSKLVYPQVFQDAIRNITLDGEAYFEVVKDGRPFTVSVGKNTIDVMGTSFNVKQKGNGDLSVALVEGKVKVNDKSGNQVFLDPNEMLVIQENGEFYKSGFNPLEITSWKDMNLVFSRDSFEEVKAKIENWYGVEIEVKGRIHNNWVYSGEYKEESLENVLRGISLTSGLKYKIEGKKVIINKP